MIKNPSANTGDSGDLGSIPGLGRSLGGGNGNQIQYSCWGNPIDIYIYIYIYTYTHIHTYIYAYACIYTLYIICNL